MSLNNILYDQFALYYDTYSKSRLNYLKTVNKLIAANTKTLSRIRTYADFGCGTGRRSLEISRLIHAEKVILIDSSKEMINQCQKICKTAINFDFTKKDMTKKIKQMTVLTSLWNVFGHIETEQKRQQALNNLYDCLENGGLMFVDVNNRYNASNYGWKAVLKNITKDLGGILNISGDISFFITAKDQTLPATVHLFAPRELDRLILKSNFKILKKYYVNYNTGKIEKWWFQGQILYVCGV